MNTILIVSSLLLVIIAAVITIHALKQEEKKMNEYSTKEFSFADAQKRSKHYEENSVSTMLPIQIWTYIIGFIVTVILITAFAIYY
ncbi:hypothetical protein ACFSKI_02275 [Pseudogracilibacillus auburnensis]|uniref:Uncharacterized protein n=1 Tax=Pseudogracilibacillus auburnensis TaxID=1494959 RepID=A0A2V3W1K8_9BACI|nr:hypothetical protein [Pseudogracilibacillus auburnensis]MBO1002967.1 hypothetical protein [Pseudogracilibacillus auburnensis]PXW87064.1 hypothetical protein DFR56_106133 [Pseudogracilibacillus auburnensis]